MKIRLAMSENIHNNNKILHLEKKSFKMSDYYLSILCA